MDDDNESEFVEAIQRSQDTITNAKALLSLLRIELNLDETSRDETNKDVKELIS